MSDQYRVRDKEGMYFITITVVDWIDVFSRKTYGCMIIDALKYCQENKGLIIHAYCLMSNHLHMIVSAKEGADLPAIIRDFKKYTSKKVVEMIINEPESRRAWMLNRFRYAGKYLKRIKYYKVWQDGYHAIELLTNKFIQQKLDYIHNNPVKAMIVDEPEHYVLSSAKDYAGEEGLLEIEMLD